MEARRIYYSFAIIAILSLFLLPSCAFSHSGCCSYHGGICGCENGYHRCCDGTQSPTCMCSEGGSADSTDWSSLIGVLIGIAVFFIIYVCSKYGNAPRNNRTDIQPPAAVEEIEYRPPPPPVEPPPANQQDVITAQPYAFLLRNCKTDEERVFAIIQLKDGEIAVRIFEETGEEPMSMDDRLGVSLEEIIVESGVDRPRVLDIMLDLMEKGTIRRLPNGKYAIL